MPRFACAKGGNVPGLQSLIVIDPPGARLPRPAALTANNPRAAFPGTDPDGGAVTRHRHVLLILKGGGPGTKKTGLKQAYHVGFSPALCAKSSQPGFLPLPDRCGLALTGLQARRKALSKLLPISTATWRPGLIKSAGRQSTPHRNGGQNVRAICASPARRSGQYGC